MSEINNFIRHSASLESLHDLSGEGGMEGKSETERERNRTKATEK